MWTGDSRKRVEKLCTKWCLVRTERGVQEELNGGHEARAKKFTANLNLSLVWKLSTACSGRERGSFLIGKGHAVQLGASEFAGKSSRSSNRRSYVVEMEIVGSWRMLENQRLCK